VGTAFCRAGPAVAAVAASANTRPVAKSIDFIAVLLEQWPKAALLAVNS